MRQHFRIWLLLLLALLLAGCQGGSSEVRMAEDCDTLALMLTQIQHCSRLYTTEYRIHKVVACESDRRVGGLGFSIGLNVFGQRKVLIPMEATVKGYVDLSRLSASNIERQGRRVVITLPDPEVMLTATRIDHEGIRHYVTGFRDDFSDRELAGLEAQGREAIIDDIPSLGVERAARASAARLLIPLLSQLGFAEEDVTIVFRKDYSPFDLRRTLR